MSNARSRACGSARSCIQPCVSHSRIAPGRASESGEEAQAIPFLKRFTVFNSDQCDGLPPEIATTAPPPPPGLIEPQVEYLIRATGIDFRIGGNRAFYAPTEDYVQVPPPQAYFEPINWHRTALHELAHASGQAKGLTDFSIQKIVDQVQPNENQQDLLNALKAASVSAGSFGRVRQGRQATRRREQLHLDRR